MPRDLYPIDELIARVEPIIGRQKAEKARLLYELGDDDRKARIRKILAINGRRVLNDSLLPDHIMLPPSSSFECLGKGEVYAGDVCYGRYSDGSHREIYPIFLNLDDISNHVLLTGASGVGKTTLAYHLAIGLAKKNVGLIVFDWNRTWRSLLGLSEAENPFVKDIRVFTIGRDVRPFCWNMFFCPPPNISFSSWASIVAGKPLQKSLLGGQGVADFLENEAEALMNAYRRGILKLLPNVNDLMKNIIPQRASARQLLWKQSAERILRELTRDGIKEVFGSRNPINIATDILDRGGITILEMDIETPPHIRSLLQEVFLNYMLIYFMHKGEINNGLRMGVILEEFPNMLPTSKTELQVGTPIIKTIFKEARKFGLGLIAIAQEASELPNYVLANAKVHAHFCAQTSADIEASSNSLSLERHQTPFLGLIWRGEAIMKVNGRVKNCLVKTPPPPFKRQITDTELKEWVKKWQN